MKQRYQKLCSATLRQYGNCVCSKKHPLSHFRGCKWGYLFFGQKQTGAERVAMATPQGCHFVSFVMHIYGAKFQEHCFNIS